MSILHRHACTSVCETWLYETTITPPLDTECKNVTLMAGLGLPGPLFCRSRYAQAHVFFVGPYVEQAARAIRHTPNRPNFRPVGQCIFEDSWLDYLINFAYRFTYSIDNHDTFWKYNTAGCHPRPWQHCINSIKLSFQCIGNVHRHAFWLYTTHVGG